MPKVTYYYLGGQCPARDYQGAEAEAAAELLGLEYEAVDITGRPDVAAHHALFFPGTTIIDDFAIPFPSRREEILELLRRKGPLPGEQSYAARASGRLDEVSWLTPAMAPDVCAVCLARPSEASVAGKRAFFEGMSVKVPHGALGLVGKAGGRVVAVAEFLPESVVPYPIPDKRPDGAFVTCLYGVDAGGGGGGGVDYRPALVQRLMADIHTLGYSRLTILAGDEMPYPNGPASLLSAHGFRDSGELAIPVLLRYRRDTARLLRWESVSG